MTMKIFAPCRCHWLTVFLARAALGVLMTSCATTSGCRHGSNNTPAVALTNQAGISVRVRTELAVNEEDQHKGLMFRRHLESDTGMLFIYPAEGSHSFYMKNTLIPLDMLFIGDNRRITGIVEQAQPLTLESRGGDFPSRFILEVNGGFAKLHNIKPGDKVEFENIESY